MKGIAAFRRREVRDNNRPASGPQRQAYGIGGNTSKPPPNREEFYFQCNLYFFLSLI